MDVLGIRKALLLNRSEAGSDVEDFGHDNRTVVHRLCENIMPSLAAKYSQG